jgi:hypothetical protein
MNKPTLLNKTEQAAIYKVADLLNHYKGTGKARVAAHDLRVLLGPDAIAQLTEGVTE